MEDAAPETWNIAAIAITDNGIGFDEDNWTSFNEADSRRKEDRGGRGLGRFTWLKVFIYAEVESYFVENGQTRKRSFKFRRSDQGIEEETESAAEGPPRTRVRMYGLGDEYRRSMPKTARGIAERLVEHFLPQLVLGTMPRLTVSDPAAAAEVDLYQVYDELVSGTRTDAFEVAGAEFELTHFVVTPEVKSDHVVVLTANGRKVEEWNKLSKEVPDLRGSLSKALEYTGGDGEMAPDLLPYVGRDHVYYAGYLSGKYLDRNVNPGNRLSVDFDGQTSAEDGSVLTQQALREAVLDRVQDYLTPFISPLRHAAEKRIADLLESDLPQFRSVVGHKPEVVNRIGVGDSAAKIERVLYDAHSELRHEAIETASAMQTASADEIEGGQFDGFAERWNDLAKDELARYVIHRRHTLDLLDVYLQAAPDKKLALEDQVHKLIYPMRTKSAEVDPDAQNLWLIDERLAFHRFLASDVPLSDFDVAEIDSKRRPDLAVFNSRVALVGEERGPYSDVSIFEFKKPRRDDYKEGKASKDPFAQLYDYVDLIRSGKAQTLNHRLIKVDESTTRFFLYLVADMTPKLEKIIKRTGGFMPTADGEGMYKFNSSYNAYIEVMSWDKLVGDARKRNEVLFHKLGIPKHLDA